MCIKKQFICIIFSANDADKLILMQIITNYKAS